MDALVSKWKRARDIPRYAGDEKVSSTTLNLNHFRTRRDVTNFLCKACLFFHRFIWARPRHEKWDLTEFCHKECNQD